MSVCQITHCQQYNRDVGLYSSGPLPLVGRHQGQQYQEASSYPKASHMLSTPKYQDSALYSAIQQANQIEQYNQQGSGLYSGQPSNYQSNPMVQYQYGGRENQMPQYQEAASYSGASHAPVTQYQDATPGVYFGARQNQYPQYQEANLYSSGNKYQNQGQYHESASSYSNPPSQMPAPQQYQDTTSYGGTSHMPSPQYQEANTYSGPSYTPSFQYPEGNSYSGSRQNQQAQYQGADSSSSYYSPGAPQQYQESASYSGASHEPAPQYQDTSSYSSPSYGNQGSQYQEAGSYGGGYNTKERPQVNLGISLKVPAMKINLGRMNMPKISIRAKIKQNHGPKVINVPEMHIDTNSKIPGPHGSQATGYSSHDSYSGISYQGNSPNGGSVIILN